MSYLFTSDDQNTGASTLVLPVNIKGWLTLRLTGLISLLSNGHSGVFSSTTVWRHQFFHILPSFPYADDMVLYRENHKDSTQKLLDPINEFSKICWIIKKATEFQKNIYFCSLTIPKPLTAWITINCGKFWRRWEFQTTWPASWESCMQVRKQQLELDREQQTSSK